MDPKLAKKRQDYIKKINKSGPPLDSRNPFKQFLLSWVDPLVWFGGQDRLTFNMMPKIPKEFHYQNYSNKMLHYYNKKRKSMKPDEKPGKLFILKLITSAFRYDILIMLILAITMSFLNYSSSYFIQCILEIPENYQKTDYIQYFMIFSGLLILFKLISFIFSNYVFFHLDILGIKTFFAVANLTMDKIFKISFTQNTQYNIGEIINLGTVDSQKFSDITSYLLYCLTVPFSVVIGLYYLYVLMGVSLFFGLAGMFVLMGFNICLVSKNLNYRKKFMEVRGVRLKRTNEIFNNIKFIKTNCLEDFFGNKIVDIRKEEMFWLEKSYSLYVFSITNAYLSPAAMLIFMFVGYVLLGNKLTVAKIFTSISVFKTFQNVLTFLPQIFGNFIDIIVSSERLTKFLFSGDIVTPDNNYETADEHDVSIRNGNFYYPKNEKKEEKNEEKKEETITEDKDGLNEPLISEDKDETVKSDESGKTGFQLKNINLQVKRGELIAVIGKSGSGKTSLLMSMVGDLFHENQEGFDFRINPSVSYVSQKAWIRNNTVKENIIFGNQFNKKRYEDALKFASMDDDLKILSNGDRTIIGDKGINLSGGQRIRVSIARSIYSNKDLVLFDDPLSALDVNVGDAVFHDCIKSYLKDKTRIVVTHNIAILKHFDKIIFMDNGEIVKFGTYDEIKQFEEFKLLQSILEETSLLKNKNEQSLELEKQKSMEELELIKKQSKEQKLIMERKKSEEGIEEEEEELEDVTVAMLNMREESIEVSKVNLSLIKSFLGLGRPVFLLIVTFFITIYTVISCYLYYFYNEQGSLGPNFNKSYFFKMFIGIQLIISICMFLRCLYLFKFTINVSKRINAIITFRMLHASINNFYNKNPIGKVLNRLSGDIMKIDLIFPFNISFFFIVLSNCVFNFIMIGFSSSFIIFVFILIYFLIVLRLQRYFANTNIRQTVLDSVSKTPFYSVFGDSVNGITEIRATNKIKFMMKDMRKIVNFHVKCGFVMSALRYWFAMRVSFCSLVFIIPTFAYLIIFNPNDFMEYIGILLVAIMEILTYITYFLTNISNMENNFVAYERCKRYMDLEYEEGYKNLEKEEKLLYAGQQRIAMDASKYTSKNWPTQGNIQFKDFSVRYGEGQDPVLKNINLKIQGGEKIGIIGRTGAGKTSFVMTLVRFFELMEGTIEIDNADITQLDLKLLRNNITFISQDSYFFEGSLRENLDPHGIKTDDEIMELIKEVEMGDKVTLNGGMDWAISENGSNISYGEKQIFCFIRAIINLKKIVIMDEATSNLDIKSENILESMKDKYFKDKTTLTIAHRLNTIHQSDKILILENGKVRAFAHPSDLMGDDNDYFEKYIKQMEEGIEPK